MLPATIGNVGAGLVQMACAMTGNGLQAAGIKLRLLVVWLLIPLALMATALIRRDRKPWPRLRAGGPNGRPVHRP